MKFCEMKQIKILSFILKMYVNIDEKLFIIFQLLEKNVKCYSALTKSHGFYYVE